MHRCLIIALFHINNDGIDLDLTTILHARHVLGDSFATYILVTDIFAGNHAIVISGDGINLLSRKSIVVIIVIADDNGIGLLLWLN